MVPGTTTPYNKLRNNFVNWQKPTQVQSTWGSAVPMVHPTTISSYRGTPYNKLQQFCCRLEPTTSYNNFVVTLGLQQVTTVRAYSLGLSRFLKFFRRTPKRKKKNPNIKKSFQISFISPVSGSTLQIPVSPASGTSVVDPCVLTSSSWDFFNNSVLTLLTGKNYQWELLYVF